MSELRHDPLTDRWVLVAPEQGMRAGLFAPRSESPAASSCPFCPGHEALTPPELYAVRPTDSARDTPGWRVRVVPSRVPALRVEGELVREPDGFYDRVSAIGAHELVIASPRHDASLATLSEAELLELLRAVQLRINDLAGDQRLAAVSLRLARSAATLPHPHARLLAWPLVPPVLAAELARAEAHWARTQRCLTCDLMRQERQAAQRVVGENDSALAYVPFASATPFECWVVPRRHGSHFEREPREVLRGVAAALRAVAQRLEMVLPRPDHRLCLVTAPLRRSELPHAHWRLVLRPLPAGLEWDEELPLNPVAPETAAAFLREAGTPGGSS